MTNFAAYFSEFVMSSIKDYFGLVKFAHTVFALPFALIAFTFAITTTDARFSWLLLVQVILCMVFARNVAMGFNRWADPAHRRTESAHCRTRNPRRQNIAEGGDDFRRC